MVVELRPHQQEALEKLSSGKVLWGGVGSGKSITAAAYYMEYEASKDVYVITTAKKRDDLDWDREFARFGVGKHRSGTTAGRLTVDSWNNIGKYAHVEGAFFIFDEQRLVGSGSWTDKFLKISKKNTWILLSATPGDTWLDYVPLFIANGFFKNRTQFRREHVVYNTYARFPKVDRYVNVGKLVKFRSQLLVHMPYERHTKRHFTYIPTLHDADAMYAVEKARWNPFEGKPIRDVAEMFGLMRKIVNSDSSRLEAVKCLMKKHPRLIVFYNFDYELMMLRTLAGSEKNLDQSETSSTNISDSSFGGGSGHILTTSSTDAAKESLEEFSLAEWNGHKHQPLPSTPRWIYLVQYSAGSEGWNCITTDAMVMFSRNYSFKVTEQAYGRIDRLNTPFRDLHYYILASNSFIDRAIEASLEKKESFNESSYKFV